MTAGLRRGTHARTAHHRPPFKLLVVVIAPVVVAYAVVLAVFLAVAMIAAYSALGHGLSARASTSMGIIGIAMAVGGAVAAALILEAWVAGQHRNGAEEVHRLLKKTRVASVVLAVLLGLLASPVSREATLQWQLWKTRHGDSAQRIQAIQGFDADPSPRAYPRLWRISLDRGEESSVRRAAVLVLRHDSAAKPRLIALADGPSADVRAGAGAALLPQAVDDATWALVVKLARDDPDSRARALMAQSLVTTQAPGMRSQQLMLVMQQLHARDRSVSMMRAIGAFEPEGYDAAWKILMDVHERDDVRLEAIRTLAVIDDKRAIPILQGIISGKAEAGLIDPTHDEQYRAAARLALATLRRSR